MRLAIVHYHFDSGGVNRVVRSFLASLASNHSGVRVVLVSGRPVRDAPVPTVVLPALDYSGQGDRSRASSLYPELLASVRSALGECLPDVWQWHNPALGKNASTTGLLARLARDGHAVLHHHHDFAEDSRPSNHQLRETTRDPLEPVYPFSGRIHHAFINVRDRDLLLAAGLPAAVAHHVGNPVMAPARPVADSPPPRDGRPLILYPVRATRRKNLGELCLHALAASRRGEDSLFIQPQPPTNASFVPLFDQWKQFAATAGLPVCFGWPDHGPRSFDEGMSTCRSTITTSVAEGFGMGFLEPWLFGKSVTGRDLPRITGEFRDAGVCLDTLSAELPVSRDAFDFGAWMGRRNAGWRHALAQFGRSSCGMPQPADCVHGEMVDFGRLDESAQAEVIRHYASAALPPSLSAPLPEASPDTIRTNARAIRALGCPSAYARRMLGLMRNLAGAAAADSDAVPTDHVLDRYLDPADFFPLRDCGFAPGNIF